MRLPWSQVRVKPAAGPTTGALPAAQLTVHVDPLARGVLGEMAAQVASETSRAEPRGAVVQGAVGWGRGVHIE